MTNENPSPHANEGDFDSLFEQLPLLQEGWLRLTQFTDERIAQKLVSGGSFQPHGLLGSSTDSFSRETLGEIKKLVQTGTNGIYSRNSYGDCVVLMDVENDEYRKRNNPNSGFPDLPNHNILGYIKIHIHDDGKRGYLFVRNPRHNAVINEVELRNHVPVAARTGNPVQVTVQPMESKSDSDVW